MLPSELQVTIAHQRWHIRGLSGIPNQLTSTNLSPLADAAMMQMGFGI